VIGAEKRKEVGQFGGTGLGFQNLAEIGQGKRLVLIYFPPGFVFGGTFLNFFLGGVIPFPYFVGGHTKGKVQMGKRY